jgi:CheY-like chemotaxis protein
LATAYAIVAKHGGQITVESQLGVGSVFAIDLPSCEETMEPEAPRPTAAHTGKGRILVMDDEEAIRGLMAAVLRQLGYEVETAREGAEAVSCYEEAKAGGRGFDAVVLDLTVSGGMGGVDAAAKLKTIHPAAKLIVSSGYADAPVMSEFAAYGFEAVIPKPWTSKVVSEVFRKVLGDTPEPKRSS